MHIGSEAMETWLMPDRRGFGSFTTRRAFVLSLVALASGHVTSAAGEQTQRIRLAQSGHAFDVRAFRAAGTGPRAAVLVLGGSKGYASQSYGLLASTLNGASFDVFLIGYLNPDDDAAIRRAESAKSRIAFYAARLADWSETVRITIETLRRGPAPPTGFGVIGISLGAMPALSACATRSDVGALAIVDGSLPGDALARLRSLPPLLTIWGEADRVFPVSVAGSLDGLARRLGGTPKSLTYEGRSHAFFVDPNDPAAARARAGITAFFSAHL